jgi:hypothetical protein
MLKKTIEQINQKSNKIELFMLNNFETIIAKVTTNEKKRNKVNSILSFLLPNKIKASGKEPATS